MLISKRFTIAIYNNFFSFLHEKNSKPRINRLEITVD